MRHTATRRPPASLARPQAAARAVHARQLARWWLARLALTGLAAAAITILGWPQSARGAEHAAHAAEKPADKHGSDAAAAEAPAEKARAAKASEADGDAADADSAAAPRGRNKGIPPPLGARAKPSLSAMETLRDQLNAKIAEVRQAQAAADAKAAQAKGGRAGVMRASYAPGEEPVAPALRGSTKAAARASAHAPAAAPEPHADHPAHWDYAGEWGPANWGRMKPEFAACSAGKRQSPIDIREGIAVDLTPIEFDYQPSGFSVVDNGHTVQVNMDRGNAITVMGKRYELVQFHFHRPSEERINGRQFDMVAHLVHKDPDGRLAVVAVLLQQGKAHPVVQQVWNNLPLEKGEELKAGVTLDLSALLPEQRGYYTYMGSLTTPPCSEGVLWMVMKQPAAISADQVAIFSRLYPMNARPIQAASGRLIKESAAAATAGR